MFKPGWFYFLSRSLKPISFNYGSNRGEPVDRYYIEKFLEENKSLITGHCLEIENNTYTQKLGKNISKSDVLDINKDNAKANIYADIRNLAEIPANTYDCLILTQVLQFIDDYDSAIKECHRVLKPGGAILATLPVMSRIDARSGPSGDFWRFTEASARYIFNNKHFASLEVRSWGNVLSGTAFWVGQAQEELSKRELNYNDPNFPCIVTVKAVK